MPDHEVFLAARSTPVDRPLGTPDEAPYPVRDHCRVTPLVEAAEMYPTLERLVLGAGRRVHLAFRVFDPSTKARSAEARARGLDDWAAILRDAVLRGVDVRVLLTDFEPIMANHLHGSSWTSFRKLRAMAETLPKDRLDGLEMIVIQHEGELGWGLRQLLRVPIRLRLYRLLRELADRGDDLEELLHVRPGLWRRLHLHDGRLLQRPGPMPRIWPATYHQKFAVIDDRVAILGGLDVNERRFDDHRHRRRADRTWHDVSCRLEGPAVSDCAEHFRRLWNKEMPRFRATVDEWVSGTERRLILDPLDEVGPVEPCPRAEGGEARVQVIRTLSRRSRELFATGPRPYVREIEAAHKRLIGAAEQLLYIESQFFRFQPVARWIVERARQAPRLKVIIVLPNAPEEVAFGGDENPAHRHGEWLQVRALTYLRRQLRGRLGLFTLAKPEAARDSEAQFEPNRGVAFGSGVVHVHSKVVMADDRYCLLSSANINGRSFRWDTEFGLIWEEPAAVRRFRQHLWQQLMALDAPPDWPLEAALDHWVDTARENAVIRPEERQGLIIPYLLGKARRFGRSSWFVPDDLV